MNSSRNLIGCAVIFFFLTSTIVTLSLTSHAYKSADFVRGRNQVLNPCFKALPEDTHTKFNWSKDSDVLTITSCADVPAQSTVRNCPYTLDPNLTNQGAAFSLGACTIASQGVGCIDPVPEYIKRLNSAKTLELLSDRFDFR